MWSSPGSSTATVTSWVQGRMENAATSSSSVVPSGSSFTLQLWWRGHFLFLLLLVLSWTSSPLHKRQQWSLLIFLLGRLTHCMSMCNLSGSSNYCTNSWQNYSFRFKVTVYCWYPGLLLCLLLGRFFNITSRNNAFVTTKCSNWKEIIISCITHKISHGVSFFFFIKNKSRWSVAITNFYPVHNVWNTSHQVVLGP